MFFKEKRNIYIYLTGGLGNQLFQFTHGKYMQKHYKANLFIDPNLGNPRTNIHNEPELVSLIGHCPEFSQIKKISFLFKKVTGFRLRNGLSPKRYEKLLPLRVFIVFISKIIMSIYFKKLVSIIAAYDVGFSQFIKLSSRNTFLIGYFQTYRYICDDSIRDELRSLVRRNHKILLDSMNDIARLERPLVVHVRLKDYKNEPDFGSLPIEYYEKSIAEAFNCKSFNKIWLFSDEMELAKSRIPKQFLNMIREFDDTQWTPSQSLALMSIGEGHVIANSTFSWWGAMLSTSPDLVIAPDPWFIEKVEPKDLIPDNWVRIKWA